MANSTIATVRGYVRKELHDDGSANWSDAVLDDHLQHAVHEYSMYRPLRRRTTVTTDGDRFINIESLVDDGRHMEIERVEFPVDLWPQSFIGFNEQRVSDSSHLLMLDLNYAPAASLNVYVYDLALHVLSSTAANTTIPTAHDRLIALGAAGFALDDLASHTANNLNIGGDDTHKRYRAAADDKLSRFFAQLERISVNNTVRQRRLYTTDAPFSFESDRVKY